MPTNLDAVTFLRRLGDDDDTELQHSSPRHKTAAEPGFVIITEDTTQVPESGSNAKMSRDRDNTTARGGETEEERRRREDEESIELARMLMAEEAMASYQYSVQYLRESRDYMSPEDYEALEAALREEEEDGDNAVTEEEAGFAEDEDGNLSYETMLQLGERLGDVKTDRWAFEAKRQIDRLPVEAYSAGKVTLEDADDSEHKCLVCQHEYECNEELRRLPCQHCFHKECVDQWLARTDLCPYCRTSIRKEE